jgi:hypothetical protein
MKYLTEDAFIGRAVSAVVAASKTVEGPGVPALDAVLPLCRDVLHARKVLTQLRERGYLRRVDLVTVRARRRAGETV